MGSARVTKEGSTRAMCTIDSDCELDHNGLIQYNIIMIYLHSRKLSEKGCDYDVIIHHENLTRLAMVDQEQALYLPFLGGGGRRKGLVTLACTACVITSFLNITS